MGLINDQSINQSIGINQMKKKIGYFYVVIRSEKVPFNITLTLW